MPGDAMTAAPLARMPRAPSITADRTPEIPERPSCAAPLARLTPDTLAHLRWLAEHPAAVAIVDKPVLRALLDSYETARATDRMEAGREKQ